MADSTLGAIRAKVRRLTRSPSTQQLTNDNIDEYVNTFIQYDMPEHLRLFTLKTTFTFVCQPFVDEYKTNVTDSGDQLYNFKDKFISIHQPIYIAGYPTFFSQSQQQFFDQYPITRTIRREATGDGTTTAFSGTLTDKPVIQNQVLFSTIGTSNETLSLIDIPVIDGTGNPTSNGNLYSPNDLPASVPTVVTSANTINYVTGVYAIDFVLQGDPKANTDINSQTRPYVAARPNALLYYDNTITLRPVPDQPYEIEMEVYRRPTELLAAGTSPDLEQWWQYIAYGASKKVFEDRLNLDSVQMIMPEFKQQERLVLRRTIVQQTSKRTATIYTESQSGYGFNQGPF